MSDGKTSRLLNKRVLLLTLVAIIIAGLWFGGLRDFITLDRVQDYGAQIKETVLDRPILASLCFLLAYITIVMTCIPVVALTALFAGYVFGVWWGAALLIGGGASGATLLFLTARSGFGKFLRERAKGVYGQVARQMEENAVSYLLFMRLIPLFPFFLANILPALFNIPLRTFLWTTIAGIIPSGFIYAWLGQSLAEIQGISDLLSPSLLAGLTGLALLALAPALVKALKPGKNA